MMQIVVDLCRQRNCFCMRGCHILCNFERKDTSFLENEQMTYKQGLLCFCNLIKRMLNASIKVIMAHSCFYARYYSSSSELQT